jgi:hypothetical protein
MSLTNSIIYTLSKVKVYNFELSVTIKRIFSLGDHFIFFILFNCTITVCNFKVDVSHIKAILGIASYLLAINLESKLHSSIDIAPIPCKDFNTKYMKELNDYNKSMGIAADYFEKHYVSGEASGLGFGVITNSVASALLYDIMNANEIKRQLSYQHGAAANITGTFNEERAERLRSNVAELYSQFRRDINAAVDEAFVAIDGGKTAIMKEKEIAKEKNDQDRQNVSRLSEQCREQILKDIAGIGNCKASSFFKIKGYGEYSH